MQGTLYIYLQIIGVSTQIQGKEFAEKLLRVIISFSERENLPLYLATEIEKNVSLYEKFGFRVIKCEFLPFDGLPVGRRCERLVFRRFLSG